MEVARTGRRWEVPLRAGTVAAVLLGCTQRGFCLIRLLYFVVKVLRGEQTPLERWGDKGWLVCGFVHQAQAVHPFPAQ